jgi:hypothetical protein
VPTTIIYNGWDAGCHELRADALKTGDRVIIATEGFTPDYGVRDPFDGDVVVWRTVDKGWRFAPEAIARNSDSNVYTTALRDATRKAEIIRIVMEAALPATSTMETPVKNAHPIGTLAIPVFVAAFALVLAYLVRRDAGVDRRRDIHEC